MTRIEEYHRCRHGKQWWSDESARTAESEQCTAWRGVEISTPDGSGFSRLAPAEHRCHRHRDHPMHALQQGVPMNKGCFLETRKHIRTDYEDTNLSALLRSHLRKLGLKTQGNQSLAELDELGLESIDSSAECEGYVNI